MREMEVTDQSQKMLVLVASAPVSSAGAPTSRELPNTSQSSCASVKSTGAWGMRMLDVASIRMNLALGTGDASQSFTKQIITTAANSANFVSATDVDGDDDVDVVSTDYYSVDWYENNGSESFAAHEVGSVNQGRAVVAADLDGDGDQDILAASSNDNTVRWLENDGSE